HNNYSSDNPTMELGYVTDPYDGSTFVTLETLTGTTYTQTTRTFADLAGQNLPSTTRIAFRYTRPTSSSLSSWYVDDIVVEYVGGTPVITDPTVSTNAATNITQTGATLNGTVTNPDGVTITAKGFEWKATSGGTYTPVVVTSSSLTHNLTGLTANTGYTFKAFITFNGQTVYGSEMTFNTLPEDTPEPCDVPTNLHTTDIQNESISIAWDANANVNSWNVQYRPAAGGQWTQVTVSTNSYTITNLTGKTDYEIQVQANCGDGNLSDWSASVTAQTTDVGIVNYLENSITLFPNPANDVVNVQCTMNNVQLENVVVIDVYGKVVRTVVGANNYSPMPTRINVSGLANGMYFLRVTTDEGVATKTFIKK
ncbi:MAG: fibronectin type III domain-containing protein, partial [Bacteroidales bacterium]|nr:fibronectin type III domain-containing protein [Bacteroidales bacterium]